MRISDWSSDVCSSDLVARERVARVLAQKAGDSDKLYALHAPEVECIAKGKARTRYEFGVKTSIAVTNARTAGGQFIVGMQALPGTPDRKSTRLNSSH